MDKDKERGKIELEDNIIKTLKGFGYATAAESIEDPIIEKLKKAEDLATFWKVLNEISRRMVDLDEDVVRLIEPSALGGGEVIRFIERNLDKWKEIRDLIVKYASAYRESVCWEVE